MGKIRDAFEAAEKQYIEAGKAVQNTVWPTCTVCGGLMPLKSSKTTYTGLRNLYECEKCGLTEHISEG
jgi:hypothetical protein